MFARLIQMIRQVLGRMIPHKTIEAAVKIETPISTDMINALDLWHDMYIDRAPWTIGEDSNVKSMNISAFICSEIARQVVLEMKWTITGKDGKDNPRATFLREEFEKCVGSLREKLEQGCAAGGMTIKPYPKGNRLFFNYTMNWSLYPIAFDDGGNMSDVIFRDSYTEGKTYYTRLERHTVEGDAIKITQRAYKSSDRNSLGREIPLTDVPQWADVEPEVTVKNSDGLLFGWYRVAAANTIDPESPLGVSVFAKAVSTIREADEQYSRMIWEYDGSELAVDVDPTVLRPRKDGKGEEMPEHQKRLFRGVDLGADDTYHVFAPPIRDSSYRAGLESLLTRIEDDCGLSRGTLSSAPAEARTATELRILRQRSYSTIADNQKALERCLDNVIRVMDVYASLYGMAPEGDYEVSFEWDDSIITDTQQQLAERMMLYNAKIISGAEIREWYFGETEEQAKEAVRMIQEEQLAALMGAMPPMQADGD